MSIVFPFDRHHDVYVLCGVLQCETHSVHTEWWSCVPGASARRYQSWSPAASTCRAFVSCVSSPRSDHGYSWRCRSQSSSQLSACLHAPLVRVSAVESTLVSACRFVVPFLTTFHEVLLFITMTSLGNLLVMTCLFQFPLLRLLIINILKCYPQDELDKS